MSFPRWLLTLVVIFVSLLHIAATASSAADESAELLREVQGKWTRRQSTPIGPVRIVKEHSGNKTAVTAYDDKDNVIYAHESEFKVEQAGKVRIFTFSNRVITAGPGSGTKFPGPVSFIYRVSDDRFIEAQGVLENDPTAPNMIIWERTKEP